MKNLKILTLVLLIGVSSFAAPEPIKVTGACIRGVAGLGPVPPTPGPMVKFEIDSNGPNNPSQKMDFPALSPNDPFFEATAKIINQENRFYEVTLRIREAGILEKVGGFVSLENAIPGNKLRLTRDLEDGTVIECTGTVQ